MNPIFYILIIIAVLAVIIGLIILAKRHLKIFKSDEKPKSDKEIAEEEINRLLEDVDDEKIKEEMNSLAQQEIEKDKAEKPFEKKTLEENFAEEEVGLVAEELDDEKTKKAMEDYAKEHPEEIAEVLKAQKEALKKDKTEKK